VAAAIWTVDETISAAPIAFRIVVPMVFSPDLRRSLTKVRTLRAVHRNQRLTKKFLAEIQSRSGEQLL
jgi:hypothetical protein